MLTLEFRSLEASWGHCKTAPQTLMSPLPSGTGVRTLGSPPHAFPPFSPVPSGGQASCLWPLPSLSPLL